MSRELQPVRYRLGPPPDRWTRDCAIYIEERMQRDGSQKWAVTRLGGEVLSKRGRWEYEPQPSSRTDAFIARTRFDSLTEAHTAAKDAALTQDAEAHDAE